MPATNALKRKDQPIAKVSGERFVQRPADFSNALAKVMESHTSRHWRTLTQAMGEMSVPMDALLDIDSYAPEFTQLLQQEDITLAELVVLKQYARAIKDGDTKAATFLRDTAGFAPVKEVAVSNEPAGLQSLSEEELKSLLAMLVDVQVEGEAEAVDETTEEDEQ